MNSALDQIVAALRASPFDFNAPPATMRAGMAAAIADAPVPSDLVCEPTRIGGVPALRLAVPESRDEHRLLYLHGGGYVAGSPDSHRDLAAGIARASGAVAFSLDYRLAPEHPFPAAVDDAVAAYAALLDAGTAPDRLTLAGDSAGGGLVVATLVAARARGLPMPAAAVAISPWCDLTQTAASIEGLAAHDPMVTGHGLGVMAGHYLAGADPRSPLASPVFADLTGLPPLLIQVGSAEILLDDAVNLARAAGAAGVETTLEIWPRLVHVWHLHGGVLPEADAAIAAIGAFARRHAG